MRTIILAAVLLIPTPTHAEAWGECVSEEINVVVPLRYMNPPEAASRALAVCHAIMRRDIERKLRRAHFPTDLATVDAAVTSVERGMLPGLIEDVTLIRRTIAPPQ